MIAILALALLGSNCTFIASSNTGHHNKDPKHDSKNDGGLLIVVSDGDLGNRQVAALRSRPRVSRDSAPVPIDQAAVEELEPSAVPLLSPWGSMLFVSALGSAGYLTLRGRRERRRASDDRR